MTMASLHIVLPAIILAVMALVVLLVDAFFPEAFLGIPTQAVAMWLALLGFVLAGAMAAAQWGEFSLGDLHAGLSNSELVDPSGALVFDGFTACLCIIFCVGGVLSVLLSVRYLERVGTGIGEYYSLMLFATTGAYLMVAAHQLIMVFIGVEILSVAIYPLAGFLRRDSRSNEASLKYFLLGAFASAFLLYGIALMYGAVGIHLQTLGLDSARRTGLGTLRFDAILMFVQSGGAHSALFWAAVALMLVGFCFKAGLAPFHQWTPDVYDGAPTPISAYMGSVVKAAAFAPFFRFFLEVMGREGGLNNEIAYERWVLAAAVIAILTMTWGNLSAVAEPSLKRMLAFSSVAHAGYIMIALIAENIPALIYYLLVYTLMVVGSFGCAELLRRRTGEETLQIQEWSGVGLRYPLLGAAMAVFMFSLAGFPPTAGFMGKMYIFRAALEMGANGSHHNGYVLLVVVALLNSLVSVYYYLRVVVTVYRPIVEAGEETRVEHSRPAEIAIAICAIGVLILGIFPQWVIGPVSGVLLGR